VIHRTTGDSTDRESIQFVATERQATIMAALSALCGIDCSCPFDRNIIKVIDYSKDPRWARFAPVD
jgi:hypothetical protein